MHKIVVVLTLAALAGGGTPLATAQQALDKRGVRIQIYFCRGDPHGSRRAGNLEVLAAPALRMQNKQSASVFYGQTVSLPIVGGGLREADIGVEIEVVPRLVADGKVLLEMAVGHSFVNIRNEGTSLIESRRWMVAWHGRLGEKCRIRLPGDGPEAYWMEVIVEEARR